MQCLDADEAITVIPRPPMEPLKIKYMAIDHGEIYNYIEVCLNERRKYLKKHEENVIRKGKINFAITRLKALWNLNRYEVASGL